MHPFSNENFHKDSTMFRDDLVEHLTSWLSINPIKGCSLKCAYCFRANWFEDSKAQQVANLEDSLDALVSHPNFVPNETPISINNNSTDPLLPTSRKITFEAIRQLEKLQYKNPFIIISKLRLLDEDLQLLGNLKFIRPIFFSSFSLVPKHIEPTPIKPRIENLKRLKSMGIPSVLYFRPIVKGWNDSVDIIKKALSVSQEYCNAICIGGLRMSPEIRSELLKVGEDFSHFPDEFHLKTFQDDIEKRILETYEKNNFNIPLFKHSSCAVSYVLKVPNYNHLYKNSKRNCLSTCPQIQQTICNNEN